jgi:protein disulfide-isomerase A1
MKLHILIFLSLFIYSVSTDKFPFDEEVIILTDSTYENAIDFYDNLMIYFYAPWCNNCQAFEPEYQKAAAVLKKENIYLAKIDSSTDKKAAQKYKVSGYPTILFFLKGDPIEFTGRTQREVINWARKKAGSVIQNIDEREELEKFMKDNEICFVYFGDDIRDLKIVDKASKIIEDFPFASTSNEYLIKKYGRKGSLVLFKHFDEKKNELRKINLEKIIEFSRQYALPKVMMFNDKAVQYIFQKKNPALILYADKKSVNWNKYGNILIEISEKINRKLAVVITDIKEGIALRLAEYVGIKENDLPLVSILDTRKDDLKKYNMDDEISVENILNFIEKWEKDQLKRQLKSENEPKLNNGNVFNVVGKTFEKEVIKNDKDVMLLFYAPWCTHCKELSPKYEEVAKKLRNNNPKLLIARIDGSQNDVESISISGFPTIMFFPGNRKDKTPIEYKGRRTTEDIIAFIKEHSATKIIDNNEDELNNTKKGKNKDIKNEDNSNKKKNEKITDL